MKKQEMIDSIYKEIANKELSKGCLIAIDGEVAYMETENGASFRSVFILGEVITEDEYLYIGEYPKDDHYGDDFDINFIDKSNPDCEVLCETGDIIKIIGHPVLIGDVLDYTNNNKEVYEGVSLGEGVWIEGKEVITLCICSKWESKKLPIEKQSEECIIYIYNLLPKGQNTKN